MKLGLREGTNIEGEEGKVMLAVVVDITVKYKNMFKQYTTVTLTPGMTM